MSGTTAPAAAASRSKCSAAASILGMLAAAVAECSSHAAPCSLRVLGAAATRRSMHGMVGRKLERSHATAVSTAVGAVGRVLIQHRLAAAGAYAPHCAHQQQRDQQQDLRGTWWER